MQELLQRLNSLMEQNGLNAKQLTSELGISNSSFTDWKKGKGTPSASTLVKLAEYFDVSLDWLLLGKHKDVSLDFSSNRDAELLNKFHRLSPELQTGLLMYIDGLLAAMPHSGEEQESSTSQAG